jgi:hypothetical protein
MNRRICMNRKCPGYGRVVYAGATRCVFCKWDLKAAQRQMKMPAASADTDDSPRLVKSTGGEGGI